MYAFWASSKGYDFNFLGPILFSGLMGLFFWGFFQIFFPMVSGSANLSSSERPMNCDVEDRLAPGLSLVHTATAQAWYPDASFSPLLALVCLLSGMSLSLALLQGPIGETIFAGLGALIFAGYIVFDTGAAVWQPADRASVPNLVHGVEAQETYHCLGNNTVPPHGVQVLFRSWPSSISVCPACCTWLWLQPCDLLILGELNTTCANAVS